MEDKESDLTPWDDLKKWLREGNGIYWLSGKAGSGKSTLMKYIDQDPRTMEFLEEWASPMPLARASFYFWNPGTSMQKSQLGLLRSLLYEILLKRPSLIPKVLPSHWQSGSAHGWSSFSWTLSGLLSALKVLSEEEFKTNFCFLIDGLDEFDGDHQNLVDLLSRITSTGNIKILASSRPWLVFQDAFKNCPKLILQDLTRNDIQIFAHDSLYNHPRFSRLLSLEPERAPMLVTDIVNKASGVFLWVYLVVRSLMEGLTNADRMSDLQRRLEGLPADLEQYFLHILTSLDQFYLQQASQLFRFALEARKPLLVLTYSYLEESDGDHILTREIKPLSKEEEITRCEEFERRLNSRCKGLLECRKRQACDEYSDTRGVIAEQINFEVDFLHRTVRDFLSTPTVQVQLVIPDTSEFNANMMLARAFVLQMKELRRASHVESNFQALWTLVNDMLYHIRRVGDNVPPLAQISLLDEMDRVAAHFRKIAIIKNRCKPEAHWVNTGYRFGFEPAWNNDFLTLCIQHNLISYVDHKLRGKPSLTRTGRPFLSFAITGLRVLEGNWGAHPVPLDEVQYSFPRVEMIRLLLERGADPNAMDEDKTIWHHYLISIYNLAAKYGPLFSKRSAGWFEITKLMLLHGADPRAHVSITRNSKKLVERVNLRKNTELSKHIYSASDILHVIFDGNYGVDTSELEDLLDQHELQHNPSVETTYLQVAKAGVAGTVTEQDSRASSMSQVSAQSAPIVIPSEPLPQKEKRHSRLSSWVKKIARSSE